MSLVLTESELRKAVEQGTLIKGGDPSCAEGLKYDFRLGTRILLGQRQPIHVPALPENEKRALSLKPGELVYVMTEEQLDLPGDIKAELSLKRKMSHAGVLVLGGFCVDPGYKGRLMFALYNLSSEPFPLAPGRKLIAAQFYRLSPEEVPPSQEYKPLEDFPPDIVRLMLHYQPSSPDSLRTAIDELKKSLENLRSEFRTKEEWFERFQRLLEQHGKQIEKLTDGLRDETQNRKEMEREFRQEMLAIQRRTTWTAATVAMITAIVVAIVGGSVVGLILKVFGAT